MAQTWQLGVEPVRPGTYYRREREGVSVAGATNGVLAVLFRSNWGQLNKVVEASQVDLNNLSDIFGTGAGVEAIRQGLLGGATTIRAVRVGGDDGACASATLKTIPIERDVVTPETLTCTVEGDNRSFEVPENFDYDNFTAKSGNVDIEPFIELGEGLITLTNDGAQRLTDDTFIIYWNSHSTVEDTFDAVKVTARFEGQRDFSVTIRNNLITDKRQILIYDGTEVFTAASFEPGGDEAQSLVDALKSDKFFVAEKLHEGELADVTQVTLTGGQNPTATTESYVKGTDILERYSWNCICADSDDSAVNGILSAYVKQGWNTGQLGIAVVGGRKTQDLESRMSWAAACNDEKIVYVLSGFVDTDGCLRDGWQSAARVAGMIASCETNASLTHSVISGALELAEDLSIGEMTRAEQRGCLVLSLNSENQVQVDSAINTLVTEDSERDKGWSKIRRTKCRFELMDRINRTCDRLVGFVNNDVNGRLTVVSAMQKVLNEMVAEGKLFNGSYAEEDPRYQPEADKAYFLLRVADIDAVEKVMLSYRFSFSNPFEEV